MPEILSGAGAACPACPVSSRPFRQGPPSTSLNRSLSEGPRAVFPDGLPRSWAGTVGPRPWVRLDGGGLAAGSILILLCRGLGSSSGLPVFLSARWAPGLAWDRRRGAAYAEAEGFPPLAMLLSVPAVRFLAFGGPVPRLVVFPAGVRFGLGGHRGLGDGGFPAWARPRGGLVPLGLDSLALGFGFGPTRRGSRQVEGALEGMAYCPLVRGCSGSVSSGNGPEPGHDGPQEEGSGGVARITGLQSASRWPHPSSTKQQVGSLDSWRMFRVACVATSGLSDSQMKAMWDT